MAGSPASAQIFQEEIIGKSLVIDSLVNVSNLRFEVEFTKSRASVWIVLIMKDGKNQVKKIVTDKIITVPVQGVVSVTVTHRQKMVFRFKDRIDFDPPRSKGKKKSKSNRTTVRSTGGSATSTAVVAT